MDGKSAIDSLNRVKITTQEHFYENFDLYGLKIFIVFWALFIIIVSLSINNKWILAGIIAYEVLP